MSTVNIKSTAVQQSETMFMRENEITYTVSPN